MSRKQLLPGLYEDLVDEALDELLGRIDGDSVQIADEFDARKTAEIFARHLYLRSRVAFERIADVEAQRRLTDELLARLEAGRVHPPTRQLLAVADPRQAGLATQRFPNRPGIPLAESELLVNARGQLSMGAALTSELASADRVDLICAFIKRVGLARLEPAVRALTEGRPDRLRVLTTVYTGATEVEALERLVALGATVKVDYEGRACSGIAGSENCWWMDASRTRLSMYSRRFNLSTIDSTRFTRASTPLSSSTNSIMRKQLHISDC